MSARADTPPTALDPILALSDPGERLDGLKAYLDRLERQHRTAHLARATAVGEMRKAGVTWRALSTRTGLSEQYLRAVVK